MQFEGEHSHIPDPPDNAPEDEGSETEPRATPEKKRRSGAEMLRTSREARILAAGLMRANVSFRKAADILNKRFQPPIDRQVLQRLGGQEFERLATEAVALGAPRPERSDAALRVAFAHALERDQGVSPEERETVAAIAREFAPEPDARSRRDTMAQNKEWMGNREVSARIARLWERDASLPFIHRVLQDSGIPISMHALRDVLLDNERETLISRLRKKAGKRVTETENATADQLLDTEKRRIRRIRSRDTTTQWKRTHAESEIVGEPRFGAEPPETRHWFRSPRARALAYVLFRSRMPASITAQAIETAYGIRTTEDMIKNSFRNLQNRRGAARSYARAFMDVFEKQLAKRKIDSDTVSTAEEHAGRLHEDIISWRGGDGGPAFGEETNGQVKETPFEIRKRELISLLKRPKEIAPADALDLSSTLYKITESVLGGRELSDIRSGIRIEPSTRTLRTPVAEVTESDLVNTLRITVDLTDIENPEVLSRRMAYASNILRIFSTNPAELSDDEYQCYAACRDSGAGRVAVYVRSTYKGSGRTLQGYFPIGSFMRK